MAFFLIVYVIVASNYTIIYHLCKSKVQFDEKLGTFVTLLESIYATNFHPSSITFLFIYTN